MIDAAVLVIRALELVIAGAFVGLALVFIAAGIAGMRR